MQCGHHALSSPSGSSHLPTVPARHTQPAVRLVVAAYERRIDFEESRFDKYVAALRGGQAPNILSDEEVAGLRLFIGKANCTQCHSGPQFTSRQHGRGAAAGARD